MAHDDDDTAHHDIYIMVNDSHAKILQRTRSLGPSSLDIRNIMIIYSTLT